MNTNKGLSWAQVNCSRSATGTAFGQGLQEFNFSVGGQKGFVPAKSYLKVRVTLQEEAKAPTAIAFADNPIAGAYSSAHMRIGGQDVSSITSYLPQASQVMQRLSHSGAWLDTVGKSAFGLDANLTSRIASATAGNSRTFVWQPPIGLFSDEEPLGAGSYTLALNPSANWATSMVQSAAAKAQGVAAGQYTITVDEIQFFVCLVDVAIPASGIDDLTLTECHVQQKLAAAGTSQLDFTVPATCTGISIFVQSSAAGGSSQIPPQLFKAMTAGGAVNDAGNDLRSIQLTYANVAKPTTLYQSTVTGTASSGQARWLDSAFHSGLFFSEGGS
jgi:hypothetical protein